jgi:hypothetical protein
MVNSTGRSNQSIIFLRRGIGIRKIIARLGNKTIVLLGGWIGIGKIIARLGNKTIVLLRGWIGIGKIIAKRRVGIKSPKKGIIGEGSTAGQAVQIRRIITDIKTRRHSEK